MFFHEKEGKTPKNGGRRLAERTPSQRRLNVPGGGEGGTGGRAGPLAGENAPPEERKLVDRTRN